MSLLIKACSCDGELFRYSTAKSMLKFNSMSTLKSV